MAAIMSYVHTSSVEMIQRQFGFSKYKCFTPKTFVEFVDIFAKCCDLIWKDKQVKKCHLGCPRSKTNKIFSVESS